MIGLKNIAVLIVLILMLFQGKSFGQSKNEESVESVYKINKKIEIPVTLGVFGLNLFGFEYLRNKPTLELEEILSLDKMDVWRFDRVAIEQDASFIYRAHDLSDVFMNSTVLLPSLLALDENIRKDWLDLLVLYGETHAINTAFYLSVTSATKRIRPFNYNEDVPLEEKLEAETRNSFFSGHVSTTATASFFMAKVYNDYHSELGNKKYWIFGAALIPPIMVGYYRIKAMKHFPSDVISGGVVGAAAGVLIPHLHKNKTNVSGLSFVPFSGRFTGMKVSYTFL